MQTNPLSRSLPMAVAVGGLALMSARVHAADPDSLNPVQLDPITVSAPAENIVGRDEVGTPIEEVTSTARVQVDPKALTTEYGVLMLNYSVRDAARQVCLSDEPLAGDDDTTCVNKPHQPPKPQVEAAIAHARSNLKTT